PTDFSPNAYNATRYAVALAKDLKATKIILYNAYQPYVSEDPELGLPLQADMQEFKQLSEANLEKMENVLQSEVPSSISLESESDYNIITNGILEACKKHDAGLIVMGISGIENKLEEAIFGSNAIDVSKHSEFPVIIVPANATYTGFKKILLAVDLKKSAETTPVAAIKSLLDITNAQLDILHVEANANDEVSLEKEKAVLNSLFANYNAQFHFLQGKVFTDAINQFALDNQSDLIIVIPKKHGLFEGIFKRSHAKALAFHSQIPLMSVHE
ncbi:MAG: universal stress protein, partial [Parafilimonas sp.]|nr:universal stress protein [Parafilimonas sp.]